MGRWRGRRTGREERGEGGREKDEENSGYGEGGIEREGEREESGDGEGGREVRVVSWRGRDREREG